MSSATVFVLATITKGPFKHFFVFFSFDAGVSHPLHTEVYVNQNCKSYTCDSFNSRPAIRICPGKERITDFWGQAHERYEGCICRLFPFQKRRRLQPFLSLQVKLSISVPGTLA